MSRSVQDSSVDPPFVPVTCTSTTERRPVKFRDGLSSAKPTRNRPELRRMDEVIERLWDVDNRRVINDGRRLLKDHRPSIAQSQNLGSSKFAATWTGDMRIGNETLVGESEVTDVTASKVLCFVDLCPQEQSLHNFQNLDTIEGLEIEQNRRYGQDGVILRSCFSELRSSSPQRVPMKRLGVSRSIECTSSFLSTTEDGYGVLGLDLSHSIHPFPTTRSKPPSFSSCSSVSFRSKQKSHFLGNTVLSKCAGSMGSFRRGTRWLMQCGMSGIKEEATSLKGGCFLCPGSTLQTTKHSIEESIPASGSNQKTQGDLKTVLLTTSPLFGDTIPSSARKSPLESFYYASQQSLNIAATLNPTNELSSDDEEQDVLAIWDDSDSDSSPVFKGISERRSDLSSIKSWEPPVLKSDWEYEVYQLEAKFKKTKSCRSTASWSSWDYSTLEGECTRSQKTVNSSTEFGFTEGETVM